MDPDTKLRLAKAGPPSHWKDGEKATNDVEKWFLAPVPLTRPPGTRPHPPGQRCPAIPAELDRIVMRCLEKEPARPFPDVNALDLALSRHGGGEA